MEKNSTEILQEIETSLADVKEKVRRIEEQLAEYQNAVLSENAVAPVEEFPEDRLAEVDFTGIEIGDTDFPEDSAPVPVPETIQDPVLPVEDLPAEDLPVEDLPASVSEPAVAPVEAPKVDTERLAWRLDKPGIAVKNIRSGISLYDRALFIGTLFKEDYALYDRTIGDLNALTTLDEAVAYVLANFPDWNYKSDIVYNFMMAIRRKLG